MDDEVEPSDLIASFHISPLCMHLILVFYHVQLNLANKKTSLIFMQSVQDKSEKIQNNPCVATKVPLMGHIMR